MDFGVICEGICKNENDFALSGFAILLTSGCHRAYSQGAVARRCTAVGPRNRAEGVGGKETGTMRRVRLLLVVVIAVAILLAAVPAYASPSHTAGGSGCGQFYVVRCGDTLSSIAARFGTTVWALQQLNGILQSQRDLCRADALRTGGRLLPAAPTAASATPGRILVHGQVRRHASGDRGPVRLGHVAARQHQSHRESRRHLRRPAPLDPLSLRVVAGLGVG